MAFCSSRVAAQGPDVLLVTLDTTRADAVGCYGGGARTPALDALAARGTRFDQALTPVPLTLPAHASLLTGLDPNQHGVRENGMGALAPAAWTLAERLRTAGYATAAVVASRVLDRRFGLDQGFERYDDRMAAERLGEYGYPERPAGEVVDTALAAARTVPAGKPLFLWVHFYDPHAPYAAPAARPEADARARYLHEVEVVDRELGRLLAELPRARPRLVAVVGDHGESLGEHGEAEHGLLLTQAVLRVPLILAGPGVPPGRVLSAPVGIVRLAATLVALAELERSSPREVPGPPLSLAAEASERAPVYHETQMPASAFGWAPLSAVTSGNLRFVLGPEPEFFDLASDPAELSNLLAARSRESREPQQNLKSLLSRELLFEPRPLAPDAELAAAMRNLGYLSGQSKRAGTLDPKAGLALLGRFAEAKRRLAAGEAGPAIRELQALVTASPESVPFLTELAAAQRAVGAHAQAVATLDRALALNPGLDFLHLRRGETLVAAGKPKEAEAAFRQALALNPRFAQAYLALGELLSKAARTADEEHLLAEAVEAGTASAAILARLGQLETNRGDFESADRHLEEATQLLPDWPLAWKLWAEVARRQGRTAEAARRSERAVRLP